MRKFLMFFVLGTAIGCMGMPSSDEAKAWPVLGKVVSHTMERKIDWHYVTSRITLDTGYTLEAHTDIYDPIDAGTELQVSDNKRHFVVRGRVRTIHEYTFVSK